MRMTLASDEMHWHKDDCTKERTSLIWLFASV